MLKHFIREERGKVDKENSSTKTFNGNRAHVYKKTEAAKPRR